jgi:ABC-type glycerol-3-phosphate transport system substrate-binding protein
MPDYSYNCTHATVRQVLGQYGNKTILLCDLDFDDEHGHALGTVENAVVVVEDGYADIETYPENFLPEDASSEDFERFQKLCEDGDPGWTVYNSDELGAMLTGQGATPSTEAGNWTLTLYFTNTPRAEVERVAEDCTHNGDYPADDYDIR